MTVVIKPVKSVKSVLKPASKAVSKPVPKQVPTKKTRHLIFILGDQLDENSAALTDFDPQLDQIFMAEVVAESTHVWSSKTRTAFFFSAMRHFAKAQQGRGFPVDYAAIGAHPFATLSDALTDAIARFQPAKIIMVEPGDWRIEQALIALGKHLKLPIAMREDPHFLISRLEFTEWASGYKQMRMEYFYRMMRRRHQIMMDGDDPIGGRWNYDTENRGAFDKKGPQNVPVPPIFAIDAITKSAIADVDKNFGSHPGTLEHFNWPVTRTDALIALKSFIEERLVKYGEFQDAMWTDEPFLHHSLISSSLNMKLLNPREVIAAAVQALKKGHAPIEAVEGFVRQVLGWREFMRGMYWLDMPGMRTANHYGHTRPLPAWYWTGDTHMNCMKQTLQQTLRYGYAHHIQRLMVTGIWGLLAETQPQEMADWYLSVYVDAIDWVELPNVAGMALYANGGRFTSKPYIASGQYIKRMSNYCVGCQYKPEVRVGAVACPFTTLYWNFLDKHEKTLVKNPRTSLMAKNITRLTDDERAAIRAQAAVTLKNLDSL